MARMKRFYKVCLYLIICLLALKGVLGFFKSTPEPPLPSRETELGKLFFELKEEIDEIKIETAAHQELVDNVNQDLEEALKPLAVAEEGQGAERDARRILGRASQRLQDWQVMQVAEQW